MKRIVTRLVLAAALCGSPVVADTYPRQTGIDAQHYIFRITLNDTSDEIFGEATVDFRFVRGGISEIALDLASGMSVSEVICAAAPVRFKRASDRLVVTLPSAPAAEEHRQITIKYHGVAADGLWIGKNRYAERVFFSRNWPDLAHQWLPMIDHPYDKATSEFIVTAPAKYQVVANGLLKETIDLRDGRRVTHWKQSVPIASWLNTIGVAQFASRDAGSSKGISLQTWVYPQDRDAGIVTFDRAAKDAMEFYTDHIGPYPYEKLANVQAAGGGGGMEHASAIFYGETTVGRGPATGLVAHEIAHQWFGDSVTESDWDDVWLSEGFATYFALLTTEHYEGRDAFVAGLKRALEGVFRAEKSNPGVAVRHDNLSDMKKVISQVVYQKGAWTLHMLRGQIGTDKFWTGIREYYRRYRDGNASTADLRRVMEQASNADLGWFFEQWLNRPGSPVVQGTWRYDAAAQRVQIELSQTQLGAPYRLALEVGVSGAKGRTEKIEMMQKQQRFEIACDTEPANVSLDPNTWTLMSAHFERSR